MTVFGYVMVIGICGAIVACLAAVKNHKALNGKNKEKIKQTMQRFTSKVLASGEAFWLADYSASAKQYLVMTDRGIYCLTEKRSGKNICHHVSYSSIQSCVYMNSSAAKLKGPARIMV